MIYLDNGATSFRKPSAVYRAVRTAMEHYANPGRGGYGAAMAAAEKVYACRELAGELFDCEADRVVFTSNCTHGLNIAIRTVVKPGNRVIVSGFEHNAVTRPLHALGADLQVAGRRLFDWDNTLEELYQALHHGCDAAVFTHVSNVFGYILPVEQMAELCRKQEVPFVIDAAQSAGALPLSLKNLGADFIAAPGHKGLLGPQGTGLLLCGSNPAPLLYGGTGSQSLRQDIPEDPPDSVEAGTLNVPGIAGLAAALQYLKRTGMERIFKREQHQAELCAEGLRSLGMRVFCGPHQAGTVSFVMDSDCETVAQLLAQRGIAVRAGLHCAPLAHESAGTLKTGTVRVSFGHDASFAQTQALLQAISKLFSPKR